MNDWHPVYRMTVGEVTQVSTYVSGRANDDPYGQPIAPSGNPTSALGFTDE
jgi:hypothetical protein